MRQAEFVNPGEFTTAEETGKKKGDTLGSVQGVCLLKKVIWHSWAKAAQEEVPVRLKLASTSLTCRCIYIIRDLFRPTTKLPQ